MKKQNETTDDLVSIDLDLEKEKAIKKQQEKQKEKERQQEIEIKAGDLYIKIPLDRSRIREAIKILEAFEFKLPEETEIEEDIQATKQFIADTEKKQEQIEQKLNMPQPSMPIQTPPTMPQPQQPLEPVREDKTILDKHKIYDKCPMCNGKIKKKRIDVAQDGFRQVIVCKNRKCGWRHEYLIKM